MNSHLRDQDFALAAFRTTSAAVAAEEALRELDPPAVFMPTPREVTAGCGLSIRFSVSCVEKAEEILSHKAGCSGDYQFYHFQQKQGVRTVTPISS